MSILPSPQQWLEWRAGLPQLPAGCAWCLSDGLPATDCAGDHDEPPEYPAWFDPWPDEGVRDWIRRALTEAQAGVCALCLDKPQGVRAVIDHDHATGLVRGMTCEPCNLLVGKHESGMMDVSYDIAALYVANPVTCSVSWPWAAPRRAMGLTPKEVAAFQALELPDVGQ